MEHCPFSQVVNFLMNYTQAAVAELTEKLIAAKHWKRGSWLLAVILTWLAKLKFIFLSLDSNTKKKNFSRAKCNRLLGSRSLFYIGLVECENSLETVTSWNFSHLHPLTCGRCPREIGGGDRWHFRLWRLETAIKPRGNQKRGQLPSSPFGSSTRQYLREWQKIESSSPSACNNWPT